MKRSVAESADELEDLAVATLTEIMSNTLYAPETRIQAADKALKALGKAEPAKASGPSVVFNFGDHITKALGGVRDAFELMAPAPDQETKVAR